MNRSISYHKLKCIVPFLKPLNLKTPIVQSKCLTYLCKLAECKKASISSSVVCSHHRSVSSSNLTKSDEKSTENPHDETNKNILDDEEFQNLLKDFAKDFDVGNETEKILDDIKKSLDEPVSTKPKICSRSFNVTVDVGGINEKYKDFSESDALILPSYEEVQAGTFDQEHVYHVDQNEHHRFAEVSSKRGVTGVYDIYELVNVLRQENLMNIAVITIPKELHYADYLVVATAKSPRHSDAVAENVIKLYKMKKNRRDPFIIVEGEKVANWKALDMGNIVLHIFMDETRKFYDIESLWLFDSEYDSGGTLKPDPMFDAIEEQMAFFNSLQNEGATKHDTTKEET